MRKANYIKHKSGEIGIQLIFSNPALVDDIKTIHSAKLWKGAWYCSISPKTLKRLRKLHFTFDDKLEQFANRYRKKETPTKRTLTPIKIKGLKYDLYPYQKEGVAFIEQNNGNALIADEMGLGKTVQSIAYLQLHPEKRPALIISPAIVKYKWAREIVKWMTNPGSIQILEGITPDKNINADMVICNYDILYDWHKQLKKIPFEIIIADECHYFKNNDAKRTKAVKALKRNVPNMIALSGTPIETSPIDIYNASNMLNPDLFKNRLEFGIEFCAAHHNGREWVFNGASNLSRLHGILSNSIMIRRKKKDVLKELPPKSYSFVPFEIDNPKDYDLAQNNFEQWIIDNKKSRRSLSSPKAAYRAQINALKQIAVKGKLDNTIKWIQEFLESGEKLVVFCYHTDTINAIVKAFNNKAVKIDGKTRNKDKAIQDFQTKSDILLCVAQVKAAGIGIELTAASNVAVIELPWNPATLDQAIDRVHRIGQKRKVMVHYLLALNTIEENIAKIIDRRKKNSSRAIDGENINQEELITELMS